MWKNIVEPDRAQMTVRRMRIACHTTKATDTYSVYGTFFAFSRQQWLRERASLLHYTKLPVLSQYTHGVTFHLIITLMCIFHIRSTVVFRPYFCLIFETNFYIS
jgi:hypothetical protein